MQYFKQIVQNARSGPSNNPPQVAEEAADPSEGSLLAQWNAYSKSKALKPLDIEQGGATGGEPPSIALSILNQGGSSLKSFGNSIGSSIGGLGGSIGGIGGSIGGSLGGIGTSISSGITNGSQNIKAKTAAIPSKQNMALFALLLSSGVLFLFLAFFVFAPILVLAPQKFALCFTLGSIMVMSAFVSLKGWKSQLEHMVEKERLPFSAAYVTSLLATLYAAVVSGNYLLVIFFSGVQCIALLYYVFSYFPGGSTGVQYFLSGVGKACTGCFKCCSASLRAATST